MEKSIPDKRPVPAIEAPLFKTLVECSADFIALLDRDGVVTFVSPAITTVAGYQPAELLGKKLLDFIHPEEGCAPAVAGRSAMNRATDTTRRTWLHIDTLSKYAIDDGKSAPSRSTPHVCNAGRKSHCNVSRIERAFSRQHGAD
jgi:PAS domain-containing protein